MTNKVITTGVITESTELCMKLKVLNNQEKGLTLEVVCVDDNQQAAELMQNDRYDIFLVDEAFQNDSGARFLHHMVADGCTQPVLFLARHSQSKNFKLISAGAADILSLDQLSAFNLQHSIRLALQRKNLSDRLMNRAEQLSSLQKSLKDKSRDLNLILQNTQDEIYFIDLQGDLRFINKKYLADVGLSYLHRKSLADLLEICENAQQSFQRDVNEVLVSGENVHGEVSSANIKSQTNQRIEYDLSPIRDSMGTITSAICNARDITDREWSGKALKNSEKQFRAAAEASLDALFMLKAIVSDSGKVEEFIVADLNARAMYMTGFSKREVVGRRLSELIPLRQARYLIRVYRNIFKSGEPLDQEFKAKGTSLHTAWVHHQAVPLDDGIAVTVSDISDRKHYEHELSLSQEKLNLAISAANLGLWEWRLDSDTIELNQMAADYLGLSDSLLLPREAFEKLVHDDESTLLQSAIADKERASNEFMLRVRLKAAMGEWRWSLLKGRVVERNSEGFALRAIGTQMDINEEVQAQEAIKRKALYDELTALGNKNLLVERLERACSKARQTQQNGVALIFLDVDGFRRINESMGHKVGDKLLRNIAVRLTQERFPNTLVTRFEGDQFGLLIHNVVSEESALGIADQIHRLLRQPFELLEQTMVVTAGVGVAYMDPSNPIDADDLLGRADSAMYRAKDVGLAQTATYLDAFRLETTNFLATQNELRVALRENQLELFYQPIIDMASGQLKGAEALIRWRHPSGKLYTPNLFLPVAQQIGLMQKIDSWTLNAGCQQVKEWQKQGLLSDIFRLSINASAVQVQNTRFPDMFAEVLGRAGISAERIIIEITEDTLIENTISSELAIDRVHAMKAWVALDDFGTGFSSLSHLAKFPLQVVKLDRSYVKHIENIGSKEAKIVEGMANLAQAMDIRVTAEGIETAGQVAILNELGIDYGQGYYFSRPLPVMEMTLMLQEKRSWPIKYISEGIMQLSS
ncbi:MAG: EAL domain-containing protein [bacterium]